MALLGLGLFASGAMGAASYFADDPFWFDALLIAGACEVAAAVLCTTRRSRRLAFLGLLPSLAVAGFVIAQAGDPNLLVGDLLLALVVLT